MQGGTVKRTLCCQEGRDDGMCLVHGIDRIECIIYKFSISFSRPLTKFPAIASTLSVVHLTQASAGIEWPAEQPGSEEKLALARATCESAKQQLNVT